MMLTIHLKIDDEVKGFVHQTNALSVDLFLRGGHAPLSVVSTRCIGGT